MFSPKKENVYIVLSPTITQNSTHQLARSRLTKGDRGVYSDQRTDRTKRIHPATVKGANIGHAQCPDTTRERVNGGGNHKNMALKRKYEKRLFNGVRMTNGCGGVAHQDVYIRINKERTTRDNCVKKKTRSKVQGHCVDGPIERREERLHTYNETF